MGLFSRLRDNRHEYEALRFGSAGILRRWVPAVCPKLPSDRDRFLDQLLADMDLYWLGRSPGERVAWVVRLWLLEIKALFFAKGPRITVHHRRDLLTATKENFGWQGRSLVTVARFIQYSYYQQAGTLKGIEK